MFVCWSLVCSILPLAVWVLVLKYLFGQLNCWLEWIWGQLKNCLLISRTTSTLTLSMNWDRTRLIIVAYSLHWKLFLFSPVRISLHFAYSSNAKLPGMLPHEYLLVNLVHFSVYICELFRVWTVLWLLHDGQTGCDSWTIIIFKNKLNRKFISLNHLRQQDHWPRWFSVSSNNFLFPVCLEIIVWQ
jgi:hypothetical protein